MTNRPCDGGDVCGPDETDCAIFEHEGMACDNCDRIGYRDAGGWKFDGHNRVVCESGCIEPEQETS